MGQYKYVLFDLDGTLTDSMVGITSSVRYALAHFGIEVDDLRSLCPFIGPPLAHSFRELYGFGQRETAVALEKYREYFADRGIFQNEIYPGIQELLSGLKEAGSNVILATSKPEEFASRILEYFGIDRYFDFVGAASMDGRRSEKTDVVRYVLDAQGIVPGDGAVMVGDRRYDITGAHDNGIPAIGVLYGYGSREELSEAGADMLAGGVEELKGLLL